MSKIKMFEDFKNNKIHQYLKELDKFGLNIGEYAIFGSGPLAIRGYIEPSDLDVIVKKEFYKFEKSPIVIGNIEFTHKWPGFDSSEIDSLIDNAEIIGGYPFVRLKNVKRYKKYMNREKDRKHLKYLK